MQYQKITFKLGLVDFGTKFRILVIYLRLNILGTSQKKKINKKFLKSTNKLKIATTIYLKLIERNCRCNVVKKGTCQMHNEII